MVTNNFITNLGLMHGYAQKALELTDFEGVARLSGPPTSTPFGAISLRLANSSTQGISFGSDGTPPTKDDYRLGNQITSGLTATFSGKVNGQVITITNTSSEDITIREVGRFCTQSVYITANSTSGSTRAFLVERTVLDVPLVINPGGYGILNYDLSFEIA